MSIDPLLIPLGQASFACYDNTPPTWSADSHVYLTFAKGLPGIPDGTPIFAYEGTASGMDWLVNFTAIPYDIHDHPEVGPVHLGWRNSVLSTLPHLVDWLAAHGWPQFVLTGHSKGAAEAALAATEFLLMGRPPLAVRLYEPPKVGTIVLTDKLRLLNLRWTQTSNKWGVDRITLVPEFDPWTHLDNRVDLIVPDSLDLAAKHRMPAVLDAMQRLAA
jgi:hypothetical protein